MPPPPVDVAPPPLWGEPAVIRERLGDAVRGLTFDRGRMLVPAMSLAHHRAMNERTAGPVVKLVEMLAATDPTRLEQFRGEYLDLVRDYFEDNIVRCDYLMTRATRN
jgi:hypothetical protein